MTATRTCRRVLPVRLEEAVVLSRAVCPCEMLPAGLPGLVSINGKCYTLEYNATLPEVGEPVIHGYRITCTQSYKQYDIPADLAYSFSFFLGLSCSLYAMDFFTGSQGNVGQAF